jgi:hypothetical protein
MELFIFTDCFFESPAQKDAQVQHHVSVKNDLLSEFQGFTLTYNHGAAIAAAKKRPENGASNCGKCTPSMPTRGAPSCTAGRRGQGACKGTNNNSRRHCAARIPSCATPPARARCSGGHKTLRHSGSKPPHPAVTEGHGGSTPRARPHRIERITPAAVLVQAVPLGMIEVASHRTQAGDILAPHRDPQRHRGIDGTPDPLRPCTGGPASNWFGAVPTATTSSA